MKKLLTALSVFAYAVCFSQSTYISNLDPLTDSLQGNDLLILEHGGPYAGTKKLTITQLQNQLSVNGSIPVDFTAGVFVDSPGLTAKILKLPGLTRPSTLIGHLTIDDSSRVGVDTTANDSAYWVGADGVLSPANSAYKLESGIFSSFVDYGDSVFSIISNNRIYGDKDFLAQANAYGYSATVQASCALDGSNGDVCISISGKNPNINPHNSINVQVVADNGQVQLNGIAPEDSLLSLDPCVPFIEYGITDSNGVSRNMGTLWATGLDEHPGLECDSVLVMHQFASPTLNRVLYATAGVVDTIAANQSGYVLTSNGFTDPPSFQALSAWSLVGNTNTTWGVNFLGTNNADSLDIGAYGLNMLTVGNRSVSALSAAHFEATDALGQGVIVDSVSATYFLGSDSDNIYLNKSLFGGYNQTFACNNLFVTSTDGTATPFTVSAQSNVMPQVQVFNATFIYQDPAATYGANKLLVSDASGNASWASIAAWLTANYAGLPKYANDSAAGSGGLTTGQPYVNSTTFALTFKQ